MNNERGFTAFEMVTTTAIIAVGAAVATPSVIKANRTYQLNSAAQQISQAFQSAKFEALRNNANQTVLIDPVARTLTINGLTTILPAGVTFEAQTSSSDVPSVIMNAVENGVSGQQTNEKSMISFPQRNSDKKYEAVFNSRGLPLVEPGAVNWMYLVNTNGEKIAITLTSAGSTNLWRKSGSYWVDSAGYSDEGSANTSGDRLTQPGGGT